MKHLLLAAVVVLSSAITVASTSTVRVAKVRSLRSDSTHSNSLQLPRDTALLSRLTEEQKRELGFTGTVEIHIYDLDDCDKGTGGPRCPSDEGDGDSEEDDLFSHLVKCNDEIDDDAEIVTVTWYFNVESSADDPSNVAERVCGAMSNAVIDAIAEECVDPATRRLNQQRRLEIQGVEKEVTCSYVSDCTTASGSCGVYEAEVDIAYNDQGDNSSAEEVKETVTKIACDTLEGEGSDGIMATVNDGLDDESGELLTSIGCGDPNDNGGSTAGLVGEEFRDTESQGLSRAGKIAVASMSVLSLLLLLLCIVCWRRRSNRESDSKSIGTDGTDLSPGRRGRFGGGSLSDDDSYLTYQTSDFNNLGLHHSKLDVHKCASAACLQCSPINRENENGVFFVNSKQKGAPLSDIVEEECRSSSDYKSSVLNIVKDDHDVEFDDDGSEVPPPPPPLPPHDAPSETSSNEERRKSFFSQFRRSKSRRSEAPSIPPTQDAADDGLADVEVEI